MENKWSSGQSVCTGNETSWSTNGIMGSTYYCVLQNPENKVDVLREWKICEIQLCHLESGHESGYDTTTVPVYSVIKASNDSTLIQQFRNLTSSESADVYENFNTDGYERVQNAYLRIVFEESENLVWTSVCEIYRSEFDDNQYVVTLNLGTETEDFQEDRYSVPVNDWEGLRAFILKAFDYQ